MKSIWKFLIYDDLKSVEIPSGALVLSVGLCPITKKVAVWALVDPAAPRERRTFQIFGTGEEIGDTTYLGYVGTVFQGPYVWHVMEKYKEAR